MKYSVPLMLALSSSVAFAEETRQLDAHEHGVGALNIAFEGSTVAMEFLAPGADIVGFEYEAKSAKDRAAIENAVAVLARPAELFVLPAAAACTVTQASAALESEEEHDEHDAEHKHDHEEHAEHEEHKDEHEEHAEHDDHKEHVEHDHEEHAEDDDHDHEEHAEAAGHTEFHAEYQLTCANPEAINMITFAYFQAFENARELEVQILTASGAQAFEVMRDAPMLDLKGLF